MSLTIAVVLSEPEKSRRAFFIAASFLHKDNVGILQILHQIICNMWDVVNLMQW